MRLLLAPIALVPLTGCIVIEVPIDDPLAPFDDPVEMERFGGRDGATVEGRGRDGVVRGDIGPVRGFEGRSDDVTVYADGWYTSVDVSTYDDDGRWGMIIVELEGDLRDVPSGVYVVDASGTATGPTTLSGVYVTGCSSTADAEVGYDAPAEDAVIIVDNGGDDCVVEVEAELPDESFTVTTAAYASFRLD